MKRIWVAFVSVALGLWFGYSLGYHNGLQKERKAWHEAEQVVFDSKSGELEGVFQRSVSTPAGRVKYVKTSKRPSHAWYYADPHTGIIVNSGPRRAENVPDPRSMLVNPQTGEHPREP
jgi:hypothetical protein